MLELFEQYRPRIVGALANAGGDGLTVRELRASLGTGEQSIRRALGFLLATGAVRESYRYKPGVRGAVPRIYTLAEPNALTPAATPPSAAERE